MNVWSSSGKRSPPGRYVVARDAVGSVPWTRTEVRLLQDQKRRVWSSHMIPCRIQAREPDPGTCAPSPEPLVEIETRLQGVKNSPHLV